MQNLVSGWKPNEISINFFMMENLFHWQPYCHDATRLALCSSLCANCDTDLITLDNYYRGVIYIEMISKHIPVYPIKYVHGLLRFSPVVIILSFLVDLWIHLPIFFKVASLPMGKLYDCHSARHPLKEPWRIWVKSPFTWRKQDPTSKPTNLYESPAYVFGWECKPPET